MSSEIRPNAKRGLAGQVLAPGLNRSRPPNLRLNAGAPDARAWTTAECEQLLQLTGELYHLDDLADLPCRLLRSLRALLPHELGGCHLVEPSRHHIAAFYEPALPVLPTPHLDLWQLSEMHPLRPVLFSQPARAWKLSDVMSSAFRETQLYKSLYGPLGMDYELVSALPDPARPGGFLLISLHRSREDFTERERALLELLLPQIAAARQLLWVAARPRTAPAPKEPVQFREWILQRTRWELTPRESEVLFWLCQGKTNSEIGRILGIAERTAETHALRIYPKMGVENRYTAIATLTRLSIGQPE